MVASIPRTVKGFLVDHLRDEIIRGDLVPGQHLRLETIAGRYDVSTMPVREALRDLEAEGLVTIFPHRGALVTELSADDLLDIYDIRATLEAMAARLAVPRITQATLVELHSLVDQMDSQMDDVVTLVKLNHHFHRTLYRASGRMHLCELNDNLRYRTQHYLHAYIADLGGMSLAQGEHKAILEACERGDAEQAAEIVHEHVGEVGRALIEFIKRRTVGNNG
jgi:DNA-binding GntR family transcriptional regulator